LAKGKENADLNSLKVLYTYQKGIEIKPGNKLLAEDRQN